MKAIMGWTVAIALLALGINTSQAQFSNRVGFLRLNLNISLLAETNQVPNTNGNLITVHDGAMRITSAKIVRLLSGKVSFPIGHIIDGSGVPRPHLGAAVTTNYSATAQLIILQALGTNHGQTFIAINDRNVDYDVSQYFTFDRRGFSGFAEDFVTRAGRLNTDTGAASETRVYVGELTFDTNPGDSGNPNRVAFLVDGYTVEVRSSISFSGQIIDPGSTLNQFMTNVAGTGAISNNFAVLHGSVNAVLNMPSLVKK